ncbi:hypothetical protein SeMB42_g05881 [Synchytrium endobioticum]|uniref:Uncharacterized protein n=1 Tax=Synchytrium endobioticum TaxID=286115 RepID=A0A507CNT3_9FUNG|nr:hypothetical protein SeMB42_g05881 [Synchytrium endobioticum]
MILMRGPYRTVPAIVRGGHVNSGVCRLRWDGRFALRSITGRSQWRWCNRIIFACLFSHPTTAVKVWRIAYRKVGKQEQIAAVKNHGT